MMDATFLHQARSRDSRRLRQHIEAQDRICREARARWDGDVRGLRSGGQMAAGAVVLILAIVIVGAAHLAGCAPQRDVSPVVPHDTGGLVLLPPQDGGG